MCVLFSSGVGKTKSACVFNANFEEAKSFILRCLFDEQHGEPGNHACFSLPSPPCPEVTAGRGRKY